MTGKRKGIGLFGDCQSTNLRTVNHYFPQIARRTQFLADGQQRAGESGRVPRPFYIRLIL
ncbi:hypothetical protein, partial [Thauera sp.]|uniref:hypothetical protein n=1 Tax=Thauera sp. TaxID=1905334 RepID=UPI00257CF5F7